MEDRQARADDCYARMDRRENLANDLFAFGADIGQMFAAAARAHRAADIAAETITEGRTFPKDENAEDSR